MPVSYAQRGLRRFCFLADLTVHFADEVLWWGQAVLASAEGLVRVKVSSKRVQRPSDAAWERPSNGG
jgi:hypothetical protein